MRKCHVLLALASVVLSALPARADEDAKALLDKAIQAMGGAEKLAQLPATAFKSQGTIVFNDTTYSFADDWEVQAPDKFRWNLNITINENEVPVTFVFTDKASWVMGNNGQATDMTDDNAHMFKVDCQTVFMAHWLPALREKGVTLKALGELKIDDRQAEGLKVSRKGAPDVDLFFDKETHLPVQMEVRFKETQDGPEVTHIFKFAEYKETDGTKHFTRLKLYRNDMQLVEMEVTELKRLEKIDEGQFVKP